MVPGITARQLAKLTGLPLREAQKAIAVRRAEKWIGKKVIDRMMERDPAPTTAEIAKDAVDLAVARGMPRRGPKRVCPFCAIPAGSTDLH